MLSFQHGTNIKRTYEMFYILFLYQVFKICCVLYTYSISQFAPATLQVLRSGHIGHMSHIGLSGSRASSLTLSSVMALDSDHGVLRLAASVEIPYLQLSHS